MAKYVDVEKVFCADCEDRDRCGSPDVFCDVHSMPAADVAPVVRGEWISRFAKHWKGKDECGECGFHERDHRDLSHYNYCPNCGADMRERMGDDD